MATEVDKRVVEMRFDNKEFEKNCKASLTTLEKLKMALNFDGAKGLESMGKAASKVDLSNLSKGADAVSVSFSAMQIAGMTAIQELTKGVINFGKNVWNNTFGQIKSGGWGRSLRIDQANFQMKALAENLDAVKNGTIDVTQYMKKMSDSIDRAVTGTAYGYDAAAAVASQLMSSSITDVDKMYDHLRAIAGAASMTGSSFEEIGHIFTRVASNGRVMGDDLQSFSSRGLNLTATLGKALGKSEAEIRDYVSKGKISFTQFSDALYDAFGEAAGKADETWSGVTANVRAQLSRIGQLFTDPIVENFIPVLAELKARLKDVKNELVPVSNAWKEFVKYVTAGMKTFLTTFKATGIKNIIHSVENVLVALIEIIWTVGRAIREVFSDDVRDEFKQGLRSLEMFTRTLIPTAETLENFKQIVKAILIPFRALWTIGVSVLKYAIGPLLKVFITFLSTLVKIGNAFKPVIEALIDMVSDGTFLSNVIQIIVSSLLLLSDILITILDNVIQVIDMLVNSGTFQLIIKFLSVTATILGDIIVAALEIIFGLVNDILSIINPGRIEAFFSVIIDVLDIALTMLLMAYVTFTEWLAQMAQGDTVFGKILAFLRETWELIKNIFTGNDISGNLVNLQGILADLGEKVKAAWEKFKEFLHGMNAGKIIVYAFALSMVLLILSIRGFFNALTDAVKNVTSGIKQLVGIFSDIRGFLKGMIQVSPALQAMLGLIGLLWSFTACFVILSDLEWEGIAKAGVALGVFGAGLLAMALVMSKIKFAGFGTSLQLLPAIMGLAVSICASAAAISILAKADISLKRLIPALLSVVALLGLLAGAMVLIQLTSAKISTIITKRMQAEEKRMMVSASVVIAFAAAVAILVFALIKVSELPFDIALKGLAIVAGMMLSLATSMAIINWSGAKFGSALGIALFIGSFIVLLKSIQKLSELPFEKMLTGLKNAGSVLSMIAIFFTATAIIGKKGGNILIHNITGMFTSLAILIAATTATIFLLRKISTEEIAKGMGVIILLSVLFTLVVKSLLKSLNSFSGNMKTFKDVNILKSFSKFLATFSLCLIAIAGAGLIADKISLSGIINISIIMAVLTTCIHFMEKAAAHTKRAKIGVIITFVLGLAMVFSMLAVLTLTDPDNLMTATIAVVGVLLALSVLAAAASLAGEKVEKAAKEGKESKFKNVALFAVFVMGLIGAIAVLIPLMETVKETDTEKLAYGVLAVIAAIFVIVTAMVSLAFVADSLKNADNIPKMVGPILALSASMILIVKAIAELVGYFTDADSSIFALGGIASVLLMYFAFIAMFQDMISTAAAREVTTGRLLAVGASALMMAGVFATIAGCIILMTQSIKDDFDLIKAGVSFGMLFALFLSITEEFKSLLNAINEQLTPGDMLKVASSIVILSSVLVIIAGTVISMAMAMNHLGDNWWYILASWGMLLIGFSGLIFSMKGLVGKLGDNVSSNDMLKVASSMVILSSVLAIIGGVVTAMSMLLGKDLKLASLLMFLEIFGGFAILLVAFKKFLDETKSMDTKRMLIVAGIINAAAASLLIISGSITMLAKASAGNPDYMASMLAGWFAILSSFGVLCIALWKLGEKGDPGKMFSAAASVVVASTAFLIIAKAISSLADSKIDEGFWQKLGALLGPVALIVALLAIVSLIGEKANPLTMLAAASSLTIGSLALLIIAEAIRKMVRAFRGVKDNEIDNISRIMNNILILMGILTLIGGVAGAFGMGGALVIAGIAAMMVAFILFAKGVDILANAVDKFVDAILKVNNVELDYTTIYRNIRNGIQGACDAIVDARPNMLEALKALFGVVLAALSSIVGTVVALGIAFFLAFMDGILAALPEALRIISQIMKIIVDWLETPGNMELFRKFFRDIGEMLVEIIGGALEGILKYAFGLLEELFNWLGWFRDDFEEQNRKVHNQNAAQANEKIFNKAFNNSAGSGNDMFQALQDMRVAQKLYKDSYDEMTKTYDQTYQHMFETSRDTVHNILSNMSYKEWDYVIDYLNQYAENSKNAGMILDQAFIDNVNYLKNIAPMEFRDKFNDAVLGIEPAVEQVETKVEELNEKLADPSFEFESIEGNIEGAAGSAYELGDSVEFVADKMNELKDSKDTFTEIKEGMANIPEFVKSKVKDINLKDATKKLGVDASKVGAWLGSVTGLNFGNSYEEAMELYTAEAMEQVFDENEQVYKYKYEMMGYENAEAYAKGMIEGGDSKLTYAGKKLLDFLGINIDLEEAMGDMPDMFADFSSGLEGIGDSADKTKSKLEEFRDGLKDSIANAMHGIFDEVKEQEYIDPEEMLYRMSENVRQVGEWARNIATLAARGMSEGLLNELKNMGPEGAAKVQAFVDMTDEQLAAANRRWQAAEWLPEYGTKEIEQAYRDAGFNASLGFANGIDPNAANDAMLNLSDTALGTLMGEQGLDENSPSKKTEEMGEWATQGLANGMINAKSQGFIRMASTSVANNLLNVLKNNLKPDVFKTLGNNVTYGLLSGIENKFPELMAKLNNLVSKIPNLFAKVLAIKSPSRVMAELGEFTMEGFGVGMEDGSADLEKISEQTANDILNQMKANIAAITNGWSEDNAYQPVIRPVFDMEALNTGYNDIQSWFANSEGLNLNGNLSRLTPTNTDDSASNQQIVDAINRINNDDVVREIGALRDDISQLQSAMTNMQVVMNTGALVGQLVEPMDRALGAKALINSRGRY